LFAAKVNEPTYKEPHPSDGVLSFNGTLKMNGMKQLKHFYRFMKQLFRKDDDVFNNPYIIL